MAASYLDEAFYVFVTLIALINPISTAAVFVSLTEGRSEQERTQIANRATVVATITLIVFAFAGEAVLNGLGVEIGAFKIAGGLLLLKVAFGMVFAEKTDRRITADQAKAAPEGASDPAVFPLAIPIISGPGALTASIALVYPTPQHQQLNAVTFVAVALVVMGIIYGVMRSAEKVTGWIGETGIDALSRVVGIVVAAIAVQLVINGVGSLTNLTIR